MKRIYTYVLMGVALVVLVFLLLMVCPWFNIKNIQVNGLETLDEANIISQLKLDETTNIFSFNDFIAKRRLKSNYYVEDVDIDIQLPSTVTINIKERNIVGYISCANEYVYIDEEGLVVDSSTSYTQNLPVIYGLNFDSFSIGKVLETENSQAFQVVMEITNIIKEKESLNNIIKIDISNLDDIHIYTEKIDVVIGDDTALSIKMNTLNEILKNFTPEEKGILYIDDINQSPVFKYIT